MDNYLILVAKLYATNTATHDMNYANQKVHHRVSFGCNTKVNAFPEGKM